MTTIAYKDGILAADTQLTDAGIALLGHKIDIWEDGTVTVSCGDTNDSPKLRDYFLAPSKKKTIPKFAKGFECIMIDPDGKVWYFDRECLKTPVHHTYSLGSGHQIAAAGMAMGLTARQAVKLAGELETNTNKLVDYYDTKTKRLTQVSFKGRAGKG